MKASEVEEVMAGRGGRYRHSNKVEAIEEVVEKVENYASMQSAVPGTVKLESWSWHWTKVYKKTGSATDFSAQNLDRIS
jgi:hypothetical protein